MTAVNRHFFKVGFAELDSKQLALKSVWLLQRRIRVLRAVTYWMTLVLFSTSFCDLDRFQVCNVDCNHDHYLLERLRFQWFSFYHENA